MLPIRQAWRAYYQPLGYRELPSADLAHPAFPTAFNMSAGLVQIDDRVRSDAPVKPAKEFTIQKCVRYFDIPKVGDSRHLSFFEMPGVFQIGQVNEIEVIDQIWRFLSEKLALNPKKIWVTAFHQDQVADKNISLDPTLLQYLKSTFKSHLILSGQTTNLWKQGGGLTYADNRRLCGPQIEFFYDQGPKVGCGRVDCSPFCACPRFLEISNVILIKYYLDCTTVPTLKTLTNPSTEAVIGLERCTQVIEDAANPFQTSLYRPMLIAISNPPIDPQIQILLDHLKPLVFIYAETPISPAKNERGRIIRTLMRQWLTACYLNDLDPTVILPPLIDAVIDVYDDEYPDLVSAKTTLIPAILNHQGLYQKAITKALKAYRRPNRADLTSETWWSHYGVKPDLLHHLSHHRSNPRLIV